MLHDKYSSGQLSAPTSQEAGGTVVQFAQIDVSAGVLGKTGIELGVLPAFHRIVSLRYYSSVSSAGNPVYLIEGEPGTDTMPDGSVRPLVGNNSLIQTQTGDVVALGDNHETVAAIVGTPAADHDRGFYIDVNTAIAAAENGYILLVIEYAQ